MSNVHGNHYYYSSGKWSHQTDWMGTALKRNVKAEIMCWVDRHFLCVNIFQRCICITMCEKSHHFKSQKLTKTNSVARWNVRFYHDGWHIIADAQHDPVEMPPKEMVIEPKKKIFNNRNRNQTINIKRVCALCTVYGVLNSEPIVKILVFFLVWILKLKMSNIRKTY